MKRTIFLVVLFVMVLDVAGRHHQKKRGRPLPECPSYHTNCAECDSFGCTRCKDGFLKVPMPLGFNCWKNCPFPFIPNDGTCTLARRKACSKVANCKYCRHKGKCTRCFNGFYLLYSGGANMCVASCPEGFTGLKPYLRAPYCAEECAVKNCEICRRRRRFRVCDKCMTDFHKLITGPVGYFEHKCVSYCPDGYYSTKSTNGGRVCMKGKPITDEPMTSPEPPTKAEATTMPEPSTETVTSPETSSESVSTTTQEPVTKPAPSTGRDSTTEAESTTTASEPFTNSEPITTAELYTETEYSTISIKTSRPDESVTMPTTEWDEDDWP